jgi:hypothetical protein
LSLCKPGWKIGSSTTTIGDPTKLLKTSPRRCLQITVTNATEGHYEWSSNKGNEAVLSGTFKEIPFIWFDSTWSIPEILGEN